MLMEGKVAVVFGGVRGIGRACVEALLSKGAKVCFGDLLTEFGFQQEAEYGRLHGPKMVKFLRCDATSDADIQRVFSIAEDYFKQRPEIVLTTVGTIDEFDWQRCIDVNLSGCVRLINASRNILGLNRGGKGGVVVITSSISGLQKESWGPVYSATKHAIIALARSWADETNFKSHGIRFNCLCPGAVETVFLNEISKSYHQQEHQSRLDKIDLIKPETIADVFLEIVEDDTINGQAYKILNDGITKQY